MKWKERALDAEYKLMKALEALVRHRDAIEKVRKNNDILQKKLSDLKFKHLVETTGTAVKVFPVCMEEE